MADGQHTTIHALSAAAEIRFRSKIDFASPAECWNWLAGKVRGGYGFFRVSPAKRSQAHRVAYELWVGAIPPGHVIDHLCRNPACVNPSHLEPVSYAENQRRGNRNQNAGRLYCKRGHRLTPENTYVQAAGLRNCRECRRVNALKWYHINQMRLRLGGDSRPTTEEESA